MAGLRRPLENTAMNKTWKVKELAVKRDQAQGRAKKGKFSMIVDVDKAIRMAAQTE
jgi:hypothetical protein